MAPSPPRSRMFASRSRRAYRLEMESRTIYLLLSLMVFTGVVVFYLGVVTGMGMRDPNPEPVAALPAPPQGIAAAAGDLAFHDALKSKTPAMEGLQQDQKGYTAQTEELLARAKRELVLEEVPSAAAASAKPRRDPAPPEPARPDAGGAGQYTVQVFSSQHQQSAHDLMTRLKGGGYNAYLNQFQASDGKTWYRVRVGQTSMSEAKSLASRLKSQAKLKNPQVIKL